MHGQQNIKHFEKFRIFLISVVVNISNIIHEKMMCRVILIVFYSTSSKASFVMTKKLEAKYTFGSAVMLFT
jgi:hypothetical protein